MEKAWCPCCCRFRSQTCLCRRYGSIKRPVDETGQEARGMVLPFQPLNLVFEDICYRCIPTTATAA